MDDVPVVVWVAVGIIAGAQFCGAIYVVLAVKYLGQLSKSVDEFFNKK